MKIGIELNHIIRDVNSQMLKYYVKDIDKTFDEKKVDKNDAMEKDIIALKEQIKVANHRINDLEEELKIL